ncbi:DUF4396 domain-containing protein [Demequina lutea]|uniref:DUF4396 domain-containing protein n=1 Tax=Demequina lutea TaxID=431489 RepID=A0A7Y9Z8S0_9MICO|nr:DUF4396 domain-containing protein [Demequina lutea]NYI40310.1 hypothetical protein [Demequina lutea]
MLAGAVLLWAIQVIAAVAFVAWDIRKTPEATVMKWAFVIFTAFSGLAGALLYVLSCREPLPNTHNLFVSARWRQVVGSTMHCVAGDGIGILVTAAIVAPLGLAKGVDLGLEYAVGFAFGWTIFQALFMRSMAGSYAQSLRSTFVPEFLSMNGVMAGMMAVSVPWMAAVPAASDPTHGAFWFVMSLALCAGFVVAYPINWWLVARGLKHGMKTVSPRGDSDMTAHSAHVAAPPPRRQMALISTASLTVLAVGITIAGLATSLTAR